MALDKTLLRFNRLIDKKVILAIPIQTIVSAYLDLEPREKKTFLGTCPFCNEQKFYVYTSSNRFYCFQCLMRGDGINFIMGVEKLDFKDAISFIAAKFL